jgi:hypothetical protein
MERRFKGVDNGMSLPFVDGGNRVGERLAFSPVFGGECDIVNKQ